MKCKICGEKFKAITNTHLARHNITVSEYLETYGLDVEEIRSDVQREDACKPMLEEVKERLVEAAAEKRVSQYGIYDDLTTKEEQVIIGTLLGDAYIEQGGWGALKCDHCVMQLPYLRWKAYMLRRFDAKVFQRYFYNNVAHRYTSRQYLRTATAQPFIDLRECFYPDFGKKQLSEEMLAKLGGLGLAVWYMDDGHYDNCRPALSCQGFDEGERYIIHEWFRGQGIGTHETESSPGVIVIEDEVEFFDRIRPHVLPMFRYKLNEPIQEVEVTKIVEVDAAHYLEDYDGKCCAYHGHLYKIEVTLRGPINPVTGMVVDFGDIKDVVKKYVVDVLDHHVINKVVSSLRYRPTAEKMACWVYQTLSELVPYIYAVRVWETPTSSAYVENPDDEQLAEILEWNDRVWGEIVEQNPEIVKYNAIGTFRSVSDTEGEIIDK